MLHNSKAMKTNILYIFLLFFIGCQKKDSNTYTGPPVPLTNTNWILFSIQNIKTSEITNVPSYVNVGIEFSDSLNIFYVGDMCNGFEGKYSLVGNDNIQGKTILFQELLQEKTILNISNFAKGIYILNFQNNYNKEETKFLKN